MFAISCKRESENPMTVRRILSSLDIETPNGYITNNGNGFQERSSYAVSSGQMYFQGAESFFPTEVDLLGDADMLCGWICMWTYDFKGEVIKTIL